jgi:hypothetical protein
MQPRLVKAGRPLVRQARSSWLLSTIELESRLGQTQVASGFAGLLDDPQTHTMRKASVFVITPSLSRHC